MADIIIDGFVRVAFVPTIASIAAPTTTELNAGTILSSTMVPSGLEGFEPGPTQVENSAFDATFDTHLSGIPSYPTASLMLKRQTGTDTIYNLLKTPNTNGYVVVRRNVAATTAWTAAQVVEVYPVNIGQHWAMAPERNTVSKYKVQCEISGTPNLDAVVA